MMGKFIEQGPYVIETPFYDIETNLYERLATAYVSALEELCVPLGCSTATGGLLGEVGSHEEATLAW